MSPPTAPPAVTLAGMGSYDLVGVYAFLVGDAGGFVTGQTLGVDGGYGLR